MTDWSVIGKEGRMGPKKIDRDEKKEKIVSAAAEVFSRKGYRAATMEQISRQAGIAKGTTYLYFRSKAELFLAVFDWYVDKMLGEANKAMETGRGRIKEKMECFMEETLEALEKVRDIFPLSMEFWAASATGELRDLFREHMKQLYFRYREVVTGMIDQGIEEGIFGQETDSEALASVVVGAIDGIKVQTWLEPDLDIFKMGRAFMKTLVRGMNVEREEE